MFTIFAGIYYWFPKITGRMLDEGLGKLSFWLIFFGILVTFLIQHAMGLEGMPRRVYEYADVGSLPIENLISTIGSFILAAGVLVTIINVARSLKVGAIAGPDPWRANTLEWFTASPPPAHNFDVVPRVRSVEPMKDIRREVELRNAGAPARGRATVPSRRGDADRRSDEHAHASRRARRRGQGPRRRPALAAARLGLRRADEAEGAVAAAPDDDHDDVHRG